LTLDDIRSELLRHPDRPVGFKGIRNARIEKDLAALAILRDADATITARELRHELEQNVKKGLHPQDLFELETAGLGFTVFLSWAACRPDGSYDAVFIPTRSLKGKTSSAIGWPEPEASRFVRLANAPGQDKLRTELIDQLEAHCRQNLPEEMIPGEIALVDTVVRNPEGKVDPG